MSETNYWDQIDEAFDKVDIYETYDVFKQGASEYPDWKIDMLAVHWTVSEILNGGLRQFFGNSTGILAPEALLGFERIGLPELASTLRSAMSLVGEPYPRERKQREDCLAALIATKTKKVFDEMDDLFIQSDMVVQEALNKYASSKVA